MKKTGETD